MGEKLVLLVVAGTVLRGAYKGVDVYGAVLRGGKQGMETALNLLPGLCAMTMLLALMESSGLNALLTWALLPLLRLMNLPEEVATMLVLRPLSGSGSITALEQVFVQYGVDSRAGRAASVLMGASETIFYTMTVYLGATDVRKLAWVVPVSIASYLMGAAICGAIV